VAAGYGSGAVVEKKKIYKKFKVQADGVKGQKRYGSTSQGLAYVATLLHTMNKSNVARYPLLIGGLLVIRECRSLDRSAQSCHCTEDN
jgi:hypothetical protein